MKGAAETFAWLSLGLHVLLAFATVRHWRRTRQTAAAWVAVTFVSLAATLLIARAVPQEALRQDLAWVVRPIIVILALFPYLLFRFVDAIVPFMPRLRRVAALGTLAVIAATMLVPSFPAPGEPRAGWFVAYQLVFIADWIFLFTVVAARLWRAGRGRPTVIRRRVRTLAIGSVGMNVAILLALGASSAEPTTLTLVQQTFGIAATLAFVIGFSPPRMLRNEWRRQQDGATQAMMVSLMAADRPEQVADAVLPYATDMLGVRGMALVKQSGAIVGSVGVDETTVQRARAGDHEELAREGVFTFEGRFATLLAWADPYAPFFAPDDRELIHAVGSVCDMVLERCSKVAYERRFIANAAHELRTPLTALSGLSVTLAMRRHQMADAEVDECFRALERQGERTRVLIENLLDLAQLEHGSPDLDPRAVPVAEAAARALEVTPPPDGTTVRLAIDDTVLVAADDARVEQMLVNLLTNAYRYGGSTIAVEAFSDVGGELVVVTDDGPGVPDELLPQLFEPFGRGSLGSSQGSGLGLAIVRRLVNAYGGDVWYEPALPTGARFTLRLPKAA